MLVKHCTHTHSVKNLQTHTHTLSHTHTTTTHLQASHPVGQTLGKASQHSRGIQGVLVILLLCAHVYTLLSTAATTHTAQLAAGASTHSENVCVRVVCVWGVCGGWVWVVHVLVGGDGGYCLVCRMYVECM